jgi:trans-2,3-dihydro-3-hydroxyanthranilate isomerase
MTAKPRLQRCSRGFVSERSAPVPASSAHPAPIGSAARTGNYAGMSSAPELFIVDVFAEKPYSGNQLAVVAGYRAEDWPTERMQVFAREMNFSETTFASPSARDGAYDVRIFTPTFELPFAGHPTLGTAWVLREHFTDGARPTSITLRLGIGEVPVEFDGDLVRMRPRTPELGQIYDAGVMAAHLGLDASAVDDRHPCRHVAIGIGFVVIPLRDLAALHAARGLSMPAGDDGKPLQVLAFAPGSYEPGAGLAMRMFFQVDVIREDPATGSAAACVAAYLSDRRYFGSERVSECIQQGYEIGRPSSLYIGAEQGDAGITVTVAGKVVPVSRGFVL